ncbi:hypothetical protein U1Q18_000237 [Sarracenia purpurea var. burkii]
MDHSNREDGPELRRVMDRRVTTCDGEEEDGDAKVRVLNQSDDGRSEKGAYVDKGDGEEEDDLVDLEEGAASTRMERRKTISSEGGEGEATVVNGGE